MEGIASDSLFQSKKGVETVGAIEAEGARKAVPGMSRSLMLGSLDMTTQTVGSH